MFCCLVGIEFINIIKNVYFFERLSPCYLSCLSISNFQYLRNYRYRPDSPVSNSHSNSPLTLKEIYLSVATPDDGSINIVGNSSESIRYLLRVISVHLLADVSPVLRALEEVGLTVPIRKCGVDVARKARPAVGDGARITGSNTLVRQPPVAITCQKREVQNRNTNILKCSFYRTRKTALGRPRGGWEDDIKVADFREIQPVIVTGCCKSTTFEFHKTEC